MSDEEERYPRFRFVYDENGEEVSVFSGWWTIDEVLEEAREQVAARRRMVAEEGGNEALDLGPAVSLLAGREVDHRLRTGRVGALARRRGGRADLSALPLCQGSDGGGRRPVGRGGPGVVRPRWPVSRRDTLNRPVCWGVHASPVGWLSAVEVA